MATLPYMQLYVADYLADTIHLDALESGAYLHLLFNYWQTEKPLPDNDKRLARIAKCTDEEWSGMRDTILEFFAIVDGCWVHGRVEADLEFVFAKSVKASKAGKKSAEKRQRLPKTTNKRSTKPEQTLNHKDKDKDKDKKIYVSLASKLKLIVTSKKKIKIDGRKMNGWCKAIRLLVVNDGVSVERINKALTWYEKNYEGEYVPVIESGSSLRSKFLKLENAIARSIKKGEATGAMDKKDELTVKEINIILAQGEQAPHLLLQKYSANRGYDSYNAMFNELRTVKSKILSKY